jgi:predicted 2-oxoglutarate/Fe(II)-dependent dioxygenase YbiX
MNNKTVRVDGVPSGYYGKSKDNIVIIKNFINQKDLKKIKNTLPQINIFKELKNDPVWTNRISENKYLKENFPEFETILKKYQDEHKKIIENFFKVELCSNVPNLVIWRPGNYQPEHADKESNDGKRVLVAGNDIASLIYLNDDYQGGEIYFPIQNIEVKPNAGDAIFFPGDKNYLHGVKKIISGNRFTSTAFWNILKINNN